MNNKALDFGKLYNTLIRFGSEELLNYHGKIENFLETEKNKIDSKFEEIEALKLGNEDYYYVLIDSLSEEYHNYDIFYPNNFRFSAIIQSYSFLEYHLKRICDHVFHEKKLTFELKDLKGNSEIDKAKVYLTKTKNINFGDLNPEWNFINNVRLLRNSIVHSAGEFDFKDNKLPSFIKKHNSLSVKENEDDFIKNIDQTYQIIIKDDKLNLEFIEHIETFFDKITCEVFKK